MPTLLERYQAGDCIAVWDELHRLGTAVREPRHMDDAIAVAREAVRRARENFLTIIRRLDEIGYRFEDEEASAEEAEQNIADLGAFARNFEPQAREMTQNYPVGGNAQESMQKLFAGFQNLQTLLSGAQSAAKQKPKPPKVKDHSKDPSILSKPKKDVADQLAKFQKKLKGPMPLILEAWYQEIGSVYLFGSHPVICPKPERPKMMMFEFRQYDASKGVPAPEGSNSVLPDPFAMYPFDPSSIDAFRQMADPKRRREYAEKRLREHDRNAEQMKASMLAQSPAFWPTTERKYAQVRDELVEQLREAGKPMQFQMTLGPDELAKAGTSADAYYVALPDAGADFRMVGARGTPTFVEYLRMTFACGGFPGWFEEKDRPAELEKLSEGLLPI